ncbi:hypothetical protein PG996_013818 [Apiospora saccharicola]|uniref:F-box domain-containing protein n=1 Tax=Apiospora saccharicola TaxID=335842 RepID=A0ABR1TJ35_9PEZI
MEELPLELVQRVFAHLDLASIRNAALSCRTFLDAFKSAEVVITSEILLRQIDLSVLPEAILVQKSSKLGKHSTDQAIQFAQDHLRSRAPAPTQWRLVDALPLERFHRYVDWFANLYSAEAIGTQPRLLALGKPSHTELLRFQRAFYRFQLYCNVVGSRASEPQEMRDMFFSHFAAWENEQLACVYEYLMRVIATHCHFSNYGQYILSEGLEKLYHVSMAWSYEDWHALLSRGEDKFDEPSFSDSFLYNGLQYGANVYPIYGETLSELDDEDRQEVVGSPFYDDPDRGPASIWEWVHKDRIPGALVGETRMRLHRQWAYTFWDFSRLESAGLLKDPSISGEGPVTELALEEYSTPSRLDKLKLSQFLRKKVWESGGTGRWDQNPWHAPSRDSTPVYQPQSLAQARKFLQGF